MPHPLVGCPTLAALAAQNVSVECSSVPFENTTKPPCIFGIFKSFPASSSKCEEYDPERIKPFQATKSKTKGTHTYKSNKNDSDWK